jgi:hypothetical protein
MIAEGSVAAAAGPDQGEPLIAIDLHQRGVDRCRKARIVELDREILAITVAGGLLSGGAEFGGAGEDAIAGCLVVLLVARGEFRLDVERQRLDRTDEAVVRRGERADGSHGSLRLLLDGRHRPIEISILADTGARSAQGCSRWLLLDFL